jgi:uncharacterized protein with HEPN domain
VPHILRWSGQKIIGMRHVLVHGYYETDNSIVWQTIVEELPQLRKNIIPIEISNTLTEKNDVKPNRNIEMR